MLDQLRQRPSAADYALAGVLLANAAMAVRNLAIGLAFTASVGPLTGLVLPLAVVAIGSVAIAGLTADWSESIEVPLESPFTLRYALGFGGLFLVVVLAGGLAQATFGTTGLLVTATAAGLVSSAGATTFAVLLYRAGTVSPETAVLAVLLATGSSIAVKAGLTLVAPGRSFGLRVARWSAALVLDAVGVALGSAMLG